MKTFCLIYFLATFSFVNIENIHFTYRLNLQVDSIALKAKQLKKLYLLSTASSNDTRYIYQEQFFKEFPNTFDQLLELYGYNEKKSTPNILYYEAPNHILKLFNGLSNINDTLYYRKIIQISIGGHWDVDAVNYFQNGLRERVLNKPELTVSVLRHMPVDKTRSFWYFYFDGAHPKKQIPEQLLRIKSIDNKIYDLMLEVHNEVLKSKE
jgi:hypothetical protein